MTTTIGRPAAFRFRRALVLLPSAPQNCADCHMPAVLSNDAGNIDGSVHSHRFLAANTALPICEWRYEANLMMTEAVPQKRQVSVDIFAISPDNPAHSANIPA